jgi:WD40 repeat protein
MNIHACAQRHEEVLLEAMKRTVQRNGYITKHRRRANAVAFDPNDRSRLISAGDDGLAKFFNRETGTVSVMLAGHKEGVTSLCFSPDAKLVATGSRDRTVRVWDAKTGKDVLEHPLCGHTNSVESVGWSSDGALLASASADKSVRIWDLTAKRKCIFTLAQHSRTVLAVAWSPTEAKILATASADGTFKVWDLAKIALVAEEDEKRRKIWELPPPPHEEWTATVNTVGVQSIAWSPNGMLLATAGSDGVIKLWDMDGVPTEKRTIGAHSYVARSVAWSADGKSLASASYDKTIKIWADVCSKNPTLQCTFSGHSDAVQAVAWSGQGDYVVSAGADRSVRLWNVWAGPVEDSHAAAHEENVLSVAWSGDGKLLASASASGDVKIWDVSATPRVMCTLTGHAARVNHVAWSPCNQLLASAGYDKSVKIWSVSETRVEKFSLAGHTDSVDAVAWSSDGKLLASASADGVKVWHTSDPPTEMCTLTGTQWESAKVSKDIVALALRAREGASLRHTLAGKYAVECVHDMVYIHRLASAVMGGAQGEDPPLAEFRAPALISSVSCMGIKICVGCKDGQVSIPMCSSDAACVCTCVPSTFGAFSRR